MLVGSYKYAENYARFGTPFVSNDDIEQPWIADQGGTIQGWRSFVDVDVSKLVRRPSVSEETRHSVPLLLYGTFWYAYIDPESSFNATRARPLRMLPPALHLAGVIPTLVGFLGLAVALRSILSGLSRAWRRTVPADAFLGWLECGVLAGTLLAQVGLVVVWGVRHDAWSFFQARLVFPSFLAIAILFGLGLEALPERVRRFGEWSLFAFHALACTYFLIELTYAASGPG